MSNRDIKNMSDAEFMRFVNRDEETVTSIEQLTVGQIVKVKNLREYILKDSRDWNLEENRYSTTVNGQIFYLPMHMVDKSNKEMEIARISLEDRVVLEDGYNYLLDMIKIV